jgi:hypothetical protein
VKLLRIGDKRIVLARTEQDTLRSTIAARTGGDRWPAV